MSSSSSPPSSPTASVALYNCQKCHRAMRIDLEAPLQESTVLAFRSAFTENEETRSRDSRLVDAMTESFVVLPSSSSSSRQNNSSSSSSSSSAGGFDHQIETLTNILSVASDKCEFDHPFCTDCSKSVQKELELKLEELEQDRNTYRAALKSLESQKEPSLAAASAALDAEEQELLQKEKALEQQLISLQNDRKALDYESRLLDEEQQQLEKFSKQFWSEYSTFTLTYVTYHQQQLLLIDSLNSSSALLAKLKRTNLLDDAFHIYFDGHFGTINGFRLGRLVSQQVDWLELNAAFGTLLLLISILARLLEFKFVKYRLHPLGSFSKVSKVEDPTTLYELYGTSDSWGARLFWLRRFETALTGLCCCIQELADHCHAIDANWKAPYSINLKQEEINQLSYKLVAHNGDAKWTKAMKYLLTNVKQIVIFTSSQMQKASALQHARQ